MGNRLFRLAVCCSGGGGGPPADRHRGGGSVTSDPCDEGLGHSFCYVRPDAVPGGSGRCSVEGAAAAVASSKVYSSEETTMFRSISGAAVSANASTPLSTALLGAAPSTAASAFESSTSFSSVALQPVPRLAGPLSGSLCAADRGFMSGPIERGFMSGPLDPRFAISSGPIEKPFSVSGGLRRSVSYSLSRPSRHAAAARSLLRELTKVISKTISNAAHGQGFLVAPVKGLKDSTLLHGGSKSTTLDTAAQWSDMPDSVDGNIQWAQGKAGEDRVHVVVSEEHGWVFVGIYDGFNGPDATDFLLSNLYATIRRELKGLLWYGTGETFPSEEPLVGQIPLPLPTDSSNFTSAKQIAGEKRRRRCKREFDDDRSDLERRPKEQPYSVNHSQVLEALRRALEKTEDSFLDIADKMVVDNPELALMGSCVLVMLLKDDDVYLMNVGDSRAVLAHKTWHEHGRINELHRNSTALQLTSDHSTSIEEEVQRIRKEHPDDASAISKGRVKRTLKVTRAFGAGFLKQPKWNNALLEMFRIDYVGSSPYITCNPFLHHHKLSPKDRFLILSSDGLYQYFTNEEAVAQVETFIATTPGGDPAQHLVEEVLFRAAKKAGMDFHELFEIEQGDRRRYHDDISIIIISLEGQIWRSCM